MKGRKWLNAEQRWQLTEDNGLLCTGICPDVPPDSLCLCERHPGTRLYDIWASPLRSVISEENGCRVDIVHCRRRYQYCDVPAAVYECYECNQQQSGVEHLFVWKILNSSFQLGTYLSPTNWEHQVPPVGESRTRFVIPTDTVMAHWQRCTFTGHK